MIESRPIRTPPASVLVLLLVLPSMAALAERESIDARSEHGAVRAVAAAMAQAARDLVHPDVLAMSPVEIGNVAAPPAPPVPGAPAPRSASPPLAERLLDLPPPTA